MHDILLKGKFKLGAARNVTRLGILGVVDLPCCDEGEVVCEENQQSQGHHVQFHAPDGDHKYLGEIKRQKGIQTRV